MLPINYLYWIFKPILKLSWNTAYNVKIIGKENINFKQSTLIVANHTNAVIDPVAIAVNVKRGIFFLARGDAFANNFLKWLLWQFHIIPIYRKEECENNLEKNQETFGRMFELFDKARPIIIFSEGKCIQEKTLREFRKGTAHILVDYANEKKDLSKLHIQPIGINYQYYNKFRGDLILNFGQPFTLADLNLEEINSKESIQIITQKTQEKLAACMVIQTEPVLYGMENNVEALIGNQLIKKFKTKNATKQLFDMRVHITKQLAHKYNTENANFTVFKNDLKTLENKLEQHQIPLNVLNKKNYTFILSFLFILITIPFFILGFLLNAIPFFVPKIIIKKKVKNPVFESTVRVVVGMFLFLIFYTCYLIFIPKFFQLENSFQKILVGVSSIIIAYFTLLFSYSWFQLFKELKGFVSFLFLNSNEKANLLALHQSCKKWLVENLNL